MGGDVGFRFGNLRIVLWNVTEFIHIVFVAIGIQRQSTAIQRKKEENPFTGKVVGGEL